MASFITTSFAGGNDIALQLGKEEWVRTLIIGSTWTNIRIGILYQITGTADTPSGGTSGFAVGMCSGTAAPFGAATTTNWVGLNVSGPLSYIVGTGTNSVFRFLSTSATVSKKVGATITSNATNAADSVAMWTATAANTQRRGILFVDITKGSPNYTIVMRGPTDGSGTTYDFTLADLIAGMTQTISTLTVGGLPFSSGNTPLTLACDETAGGFDTVDIYCNYLNNPFNLYAVAVEKLS